MKKINIYDFYKSEETIFIRCDTFQQACILCDQFNKDGKKWVGGSSYLEHVYFSKPATYYSNKGNYNLYVLFNKVYSFEEVDFSVKKTNKIFLLDCIDRKYFNTFLAPFRNHIQYICKYQCLPSCSYQYISMDYLKNSHSSFIYLPEFKAGTMFNKLELFKKYTLEDLDLFKDKLITKEEFLSNKNYFLCCQNEQDYKRIINLLNMNSKNFREKNDIYALKENNKEFAKKNNYQLAINPKMFVDLKTAVKDKDYSIFYVDEIEW